MFFVCNCVSIYSPHDFEKGQIYLVLTIVYIHVINSR